MGRADQAGDLPDKESGIFFIPGLDMISVNRKSIYPSAKLRHRRSEHKYNLCLTTIPRMAPIRPSGLTAGCLLLGADRTSSAKGIPTRMTLADSAAGFAAFAREDEQKGIARRMGCASETHHLDKGK